MRKQFRNLRLRLPKIYDHTPFFIQQEISEAERIIEKENTKLKITMINFFWLPVKGLFDIGYLWECDDVDFLSFAP